MPRPVAATLWILGAVAAHVALPFALGTRGSHFGWKRGRPQTPNLPGVLLLGAGTAGFAWSLAQHYQGSESGSYQLSLVPEYLLRSGPYRHSRNPMYVAELVVWLGWTELFGSPALLTASTVLAVGMRQAVAREEKTLLDTFGDSWETYARDVPRWL